MRNFDKMSKIKHVIEELSGYWVIKKNNNYLTTTICMCENCLNPARGLPYGWSKNINRAFEFPYKKAALKFMKTVYLENVEILKIYERLTREYAKV